MGGKGSGGKPKPTRLRVIEGNRGHRSINVHEPKPLIAAKVPPPPAMLKGHARLEWKRRASELHRLKLLTDLDHPVFMAYCQAYGRWMDAEKQLARMGKLTIVTDKGNIVQNPIVNIANKAMADMHRYSLEFGMTPSSRARLSTDVLSPDADPLARLSTLR